MVSLRGTLLLLLPELLALVALLRRRVHWLKVPARGSVRAWLPVFRRGTLLRLRRASV